MAHRYPTGPGRRGLVAALALAGGMFLAAAPARAAPIGPAPAVPGEVAGITEVRHGHHHRHHGWGHHGHHRHGWRHRHHGWRHHHHHGPRFYYGGRRHFGYY